MGHKPTILDANGQPLQQQPQIRPPRVAIVVPTTDAMKPDTAMAITGLACYSMMQGVLVWMQSHQGSMITHSRNSLVETMIGLNPDYLLWIDSDMTFPPDALVRLMQHQKDIVGACYTKRVPPYNMLGNAVTPRDLSEAHGLEPMRHMPGGFMLVKTSVYKSMPWPWYFESYHRQNKTVPGAQSPSVEEAFLQSLDDALPQPRPVPPELRARLAADEELMAWVREASAMESQLNPEAIGEDYSFSKKARRFGYELWCDLDLTLQMGHIGQQVVTPRRPEKKQEAA
jgi:hypothetical protein